MEYDDPGSTIDMEISYRDRDYRIERHPPSGDRSLRAASAADEHLLAHLAESGGGPAGPLVFHDRFGALSVPLHESRPLCPAFLKSQENSIRMNLAANGLPADAVALPDALAPLPSECRLALVRVPKSLELFRFSLSRIAAALVDDGRVICAFMTRHFTPQIPEIASEYFGDVEQSRAWKKSRLLHLAEPRRDRTAGSLNTTAMNDGGELRQYPGVFSSGRIDAATGFLVDNLPPEIVHGRILDLGCGNGIISSVLRQHSPDAEIYALDDSALAVASAQLNLGADGTVFHWADSTAEFDAGTFDLVVSNPPFHFEHEIDLSVPLRLFADARRILKAGGTLLLVANRHLNYRNHLRKLFADVRIEAENGKFEVIRSTV